MSNKYCCTIITRISCYCWLFVFVCSTTVLLLCVCPSIPSRRGRSATRRNDNKYSKINTGTAVHFFPYQNISLQNRITNFEIVVIIRSTKLFSGNHNWIKLFIWSSGQLITFSFQSLGQQDNGHSPSDLQSCRNHVLSPCCLFHLSSKMNCRWSSPTLNLCLVHDFLPFGSSMYNDPWHQDKDV